MFNRNLIALLVFIAAADLLPAQAIRWERVYGGPSQDYGRFVQQTSDSGYIVAGSTSSYTGNTDEYLLKTDVNGKFKWHKIFGGANVEWARCVKQTPADSGYIFCGYTNSFGNGGYDVYLVKTDSAGNMLWQKTFGGTDWDFGYSVDITYDGGYVIAGSTYSSGSGG